MLCRMGISMVVALVVSAVLKLYFQVKKNLATYSNVRSMYKTVNILLDYEADQSKLMSKNSMAMVHKVRRSEEMKDWTKDSHSPIFSDNCKP